MRSTPIIDESGPVRSLARFGPAAALAAVAATIITLRFPATWLVLATDGLAPVLVIAAAWGIGAFPARWLLGGARRDLKLACAAVALGSGGLSLITLVLGVAGLLSHLVAWGLIAAGIAAGLPELQRVLQERGARPAEPARVTWPQRAGQYAACAILGMPLAVSLIGASLPPGVLWPDEAGGYDVLEYHLQAPREYFEAGRIEFLPHNVYAAFPQLAEMQYLLLMHLMGGAWAGAIPAQILHAFYGVLAVVAIAAWSPAGVARAIAASLAGSTPWLAYLGCLAYVENPMLFFAAVAGGVLIDRLDFERTEAAVSYRGFAGAGLIAGFAAGCKLTAAPMVAAGLAVGWLVGDRRPPRARLWAAAMFAIAGGLAFSPWMSRNMVQAGNPVYPLGYAAFGGRAWTVDQAAQWAKGHAVKADEDSVGGRLAIAVRELVWLERPNPPKGELPFSKFGILVVACAAGIASLSPWTLARLPMLLTWMGFAIIVWAMGTQVPGRFAVPLIAPMVWIAAGAFARSEGEVSSSRSGLLLQAALKRFSSRLMAIVAPLLLLGCGLVAAAQLGVLVQFERHFERRSGVPLAALAGQTEFWAGANATNAALPANARALLVGDAAVFYFDKPIRYATVFNRDPWIARASAGASPDDLVTDLRREGFTHVVFNWAEITRLRSTYGFPAVVTPEWAASLEEAGLTRVEPPEELAAALAAASVEIRAVVR
ncbi:MAG: hypothetical protein AMXMBFR47_20090 [Planctomycetota bacterium]